MRYDSKITLSLIILFFLSAPLAGTEGPSLQSDPAIAAQSDGSFDEIDRHAIAAPVSSRESIQSLAAYLTRPARNDQEKARAIYRWITENVDYDVQGLTSGKPSDTSAEGVLRSGRSVCQGYSSLFESLANASGLEATTISGYGKGYDYTPGMVFSGPTDHAWNAVKLNGKWYLIDSTWGAGSLIGGKWVRRFDNHYFLTPPQEFIYGHLPEDPKWQLLENPVSKEEFERLVYLKPTFFNLGMGLGNQQNCIIEAAGSANITIFAPEAVLLSAKLEGAGNLESGASPDQEYRMQTLVERSGDKYLIQVLPPAAADYILVIFAKQKDDSGSLWEALEYGISARSGSKSHFPATFTDFQEKGVYLLSPLSGDLESSKNYSFRLRVPGAEDAAVIVGENWHFLARTGDIFAGYATLEKGEADVAAKFQGSDEYSSLVRYRVA